MYRCQLLRVARRYTREKLLLPMRNGSDCASNGREALRGCTERREYLYLVTRDGGTAECASHERRREVLLDIAETSPG